MHNPKIGRFFAVDPLAAKYPYYSQYAFSGNRVIDAVELEGLEPSKSNTLWEKNPMILGTVNVYGKSHNLKSITYRDFYSNYLFPRYTEIMSQSYISKGSDGMHRFD